MTVSVYCTVSPGTNCVPVTSETAAFSASCAAAVRGTVTVFVANAVGVSLATSCARFETLVTPSGIGRATAAMSWSGAGAWTTFTAGMSHFTVREAASKVPPADALTNVRFASRTSVTATLVASASPVFFGCTVNAI